MLVFTISILNYEYSSNLVDMMYTSNVHLMILAIVATAMQVLEQTANHVVNVQTMKTFWHAMDWVRKHQCKRIGS